MPAVSHLFVLILVAQIPGTKNGNSRNIDLSNLSNSERMRTSEVFKLIGSNIKIRKKINWRPKYSGKQGFKKALVETYNWFDEPKNLSLYKNTSNYHI